VAQHGHLANSLVGGGRIGQFGCPVVVVIWNLLNLKNNSNLFLKCYFSWFKVKNLFSFKKKSTIAFLLYA
jgi:hypothetical protein